MDVQYLPSPNFNLLSQQGEVTAETESHGMCFRVCTCSGVVLGRSYQREDMRLFWEEEPEHQPDEDAHQEKSRQD
jgi:hypothetical protein